MSEAPARDARFVVIGAGPAGLTAAYELAKLGLRPVVLEKERLVGGLARTENYKGFHFDMGGHRFFTKSEEVKKMWHEMLGTQLLRRPRLSRIFYDGKFFNYPLRPGNALRGLGLWQSVLIGGSYLRWQLVPYQREDTFEQWVTNRFGRRLFEIFFKAYTEKVWGISCSDLTAEWAAQRIKDLSLKTALVSMFVKPKTTITTLIEEFDYPRLGPGMMWEAAKDAVEQRGGAVRLSVEVVRICRTGTRIDGVVVRSAAGEELVEGTDFVSSMPVTELVEKLDPPAPGPVREAAKRLHYRDFLTVCLIVNRMDLFPDNWIYVHSPAVKVARIQNFKNWSPQMVPDSGKSSLGLEYFCNEGDELWTMTDRDLVELGTAEVERIGLARADEVEDGCVVRVPKSYPVYESGYSEHLGVVRQFVDGLDNVQTIGRNGLHRYNNQDHAMLTGMLAVRNVTLGERNDLWSVNADREYQEEIRQAEASEGASAEGVVSDVFARIDGIALGLAAGTTSGLLLLLATIALIVTRGGGASLNLGLLSQYFPGYSVTPGGSILGLVYGFAAGFIAGWVFAYARNAAAFVLMVVIHRRAELERLRRILEYL